MFEIEGKYNKAKVFATTVENECIGQITDLCNQKWLKGCEIAIMPDVHMGKGCTIGTTIRLKDKVCPSLVGVDIACGMLTVEIPKQIHIKREDLSAIDDFICHHIPAGFCINDKVVLEGYDRMFNKSLEKLHCYKALRDIERIILSIGTLGGGNHFIEINEGINGKQYLVIHSGSRNLGQQVAKYYQNLADEQCNQQKEKFEEGQRNIIKKLKEEGKQAEIQKALEEYRENYIAEAQIPHHLCYLEGENAQNYYDDVKMVTEYAKLNRKYMAKRILQYIIELKGYDDGSLNVYIDETYPCMYDWGFDNKNISVHSTAFETLHNYIDFSNSKITQPILRKGAISCRKGEKVLIPINMRDGSIIGVGKGNPLYNFSGPHGAGRLMSRSQAKDRVDFEEFVKSMEGIYSTSICQSTIDESPMVYKNIDEIVDNIEESVELIDIIKPIYNFKAH